jgi:hypothetical protein
MTMRSEGAEPLLVSAREAARLLSVSPKHIYSLIREKKELQAVATPRIMIPMAALHAYINQRLIGGGPQQVGLTCAPDESRVSPPPAALRRASRRRRATSGPLPHSVGPLLHGSAIAKQFGGRGALPAQPRDRWRAAISSGCPRCPHARHLRGAALHG